MRRATAATALLAATLLAGCGLRNQAGAVEQTPRTDLTVLAAASLQEPFDELAAGYQAAHPDVRVRISYGGSSTLAQQVAQGAPADVFAAASPATMTIATASGSIGETRDFASNSLAVALPAANPGRVATLADLARPGVKLAVCQAEVPCGAAAATLFRKASVTPTPVTEEADVKAVLTKVRLGEVDAGIVYTTDIRAAGSQVTSVPVPAADHVTTRYPIGITTGPRHQAAAAFRDFVLSAQGQRVLADHGFGRP